MSNGTKGVVTQEVLPPENRGVAMPAGTPLGLGFLGAARFGAIRRVLDAYESALRSAIAARDAEAEHMNAKVRLAVAHEQLLNVKTIREIEAQRIAHGKKVAELRSELERLELQVQIAEKRAQIAKRIGANVDDTSTLNADFAAFMRDLQQVPGLVKAVSVVKEQIVQMAGGEDKMSDSNRNVCAMLDSLLEAFMSKKAGEAAL